MRWRFVCENVSLRACTQIDSAYNVRCIGLLDAFSLYLLPRNFNYGRSKQPALRFNIPRYINEANLRRIQGSMGSIMFTETLELERLICS